MCDQETVNYLSNNLLINWEVLRNFPDAPTIQMNWTNAGPTVIAAGGAWSIYLSQVSMIEPATIRPNGTLLGTGGLKVYI